MQRFPCPYCGLRNETEFHFAAEAGKSRPDTTVNIDDAVWAKYLYSAKNGKGLVSEIWMHRTCREVFLMKRNTVTMDVISVEPLRRKPT